MLALVQPVAAAQDATSDRSSPLWQALAFAPPGTALVAVTDWDLPRGEALLDRIRHRAGPPRPAAPARLEVLAGPGAIASDALQVARAHGTGELTMPVWGTLTAVTVLAGRARLGELDLPAGRTAAVPASWRGRLALTAGHAVLAAAVA